MNTEVNKIVLSGHMIEKHYTPARDWGNEVVEYWKTEDGYWAISYNDAYPEGKHSKWAFVQEMNPPVLVNKWTTKK
jgi:hypothetical protein